MSENLRKANRMTSRYIESVQSVGAEDVKVTFDLNGTTHVFAPQVNPADLTLVERVRLFCDNAEILAHQLGISLDSIAWNDQFSGKDGIQIIPNAKR